MRTPWAGFVIGLLVIMIAISYRNQERPPKMSQTKSTPDDFTERSDTTAGDPSDSMPMFFDLSRKRGNRSNALKVSSVVPDSDSEGFSVSSAPVTVEVPPISSVSKTDSPAETDPELTLFTRRYMFSPDEIHAPPFFGEEPRGENRGPSGKDFLEDQGIEFGKGATAFYIPSKSEMIVRNTQEQLALVDAFILKAKESKE